MPHQSGFRSDCMPSLYSLHVLQIFGPVPRQIFPSLSVNKENYITVMVRPHTFILMYWIGVYAVHRQTQVSNVSYLWIIRLCTLLWCSAFGPFLHISLYLLQGLHNPLPQHFTVAHMGIFHSVMHFLNALRRTSQSMKTFCKGFQWLIGVSDISIFLHFRVGQLGLSLLLLNPVQRWFIDLFGFQCGFCLQICDCRPGSIINCKSCILIVCIYSADICSFTPESGTTCILLFLWPPRCGFASCKTFL